MSDKSEKATTEEPKDTVGTLGGIVEDLVEHLIQTGGSTDPHTLRNLLGRLKDNRKAAKTAEKRGD